MISVKDIAKIESKRREIKKQIYIKIFEQFSRKIKQTVEMNKKYVFLKVPSFLIGFPTFDQNKATEYLRRQLTRSGFEVVDSSPYEFHISWNTRKIEPEREKYQEQDDDSESFPSMINLKKAANKYRQR